MASCSLETNEMRRNGGFRLRGYLGRVAVLGVAAIVGSLPNMPEVGQAAAVGVAPIHAVTCTAQ